VTSSHFATYFCDIYFEYITPCVGMIYATSDATRAMPPWLCTLRSWATVWSDWVDNTTKDFQDEIGKLFILFRTLDKFSYHILPIIHAYDAGISRLRSYAWLRSHAWHRLEDMTLAVYPDSIRPSRLRSTSQLRTYLVTLVTRHDAGRWVCRLSYHLSCERLCMAGLDDCSILQPRHLVGNRLGGTYDLINVQNFKSYSFTCGSCQDMSYTTRGTRYPTNLKDQGLWMSGQANT
jgi:hypothetical protein